jgi:biotin-(acetyl-CoA carboxylase) ligase
MSTQFGINLTFNVKNSEHFETIETLLEHLDVEEIEDANALINQDDLKSAINQFSSIITKYSNYQQGDSILEMYCQTATDSVDAMSIKCNKKLEVTINAEGYDHDAADFCSALILVIISAGGENIKAEAGCDYWGATWKENTDNLVIMELHEHEE